MRWNRFKGCCGVAGIGVPGLPALSAGLQCPNNRPRSRVCCCSLPFLCLLFPTLAWKLRSFCKNTAVLGILWQFLKMPIKQDMWAVKQPKYFLLRRNLQSALNLKAPMFWLLLTNGPALKWQEANPRKWGPELRGEIKEASKPGRVEDGRDFCPSPSPACLHLRLQAGLLPWCSPNPAWRWERENRSHKS